MSEKADVDDVHQRYTTRVTKIARPGGWDYLSVEILRGEEVIGSYTRNYPSFFDTFYPFLKDGKEYALYSPHYTATRVMTLPDCQDLCGEEPHTKGFCPVEYLVPHDPKQGLLGQFGFVAGCIWGDETSWKVQFLDLSGIEQAVLRREERFGYIELPQGVSLKNAVSWWWYDPPDDPVVEIAVAKRYHLHTGEEWNP